MLGLPSDSQGGGVGWDGGGVGWDGGGGGVGEAGEDAVGITC